jgi:hypothetical protein
MPTILIQDEAVHGSLLGVHPHASPLRMQAAVLKVIQDVHAAVVLAMSGWISFTNYKSQLNIHSSMLMQRCMDDANEAEISSARACCCH